MQNQILKKLVSGKIKAVCTFLNLVLPCLSSMRDFTQGSSSHYQIISLRLKKHVRRQPGHIAENYRCLQRELKAGMKSSLGISRPCLFPSCNPQPRQIQTFQFIQQMKHRSYCSTLLFIPLQSIACRR